MRLNLKQKNQQMKDFLKKQQEKLANNQQTCYNPIRNQFINNLTQTKLVYNPETNEWDKLRELQNDVN